MKKIILLTWMILFLTGCASSAPIADLPPDFYDKTYYTRTNLWYLSRGVIVSWSSHKGDRLPIGTKATIVEITHDEIKFKADNCRTFTVRRSRHTKASLADIFDLYFSKANAMSDDGAFYVLTKMEQANVLTGTVTPGMSKQAVLMAYGYPPARQGTININDNKWVYWGPNRLEARISVFFANDISYKIERLAIGLRGPFGIRSRRIDKEELTGAEKYNEINRDNLARGKALSLSEELKKLSDLHSSGSLTDDEFKKAKDKLLNEK